ncbi:2-C-methyl-D-erythritol 2,4-cyclodiphosphate synthase [Alkalibacter mobilis]|uniref:2-C-methyl-D-erythritol 2,4-cyclodiphosphate synthase n=1 Tax=Alkalibacter mobilis TaxID=2787712 RepID=UPI00189CA5C3|nr:2-C-methyl-D-erythritol 2,4-cyclodiphosphate synthase [Alkalibacter mobilis]MBF7095547.1 2-C-methyl-D-erythritol 2,4-cyclodiphosphate synthase [Alkalibacter mobilis]
MRIGHGYDVHRLIKGRKLILGGVNIPHEKGLLGHSDADVLVHAVMDSILGALGFGDIGGLFPDTDDSFAGIDSLILLSKVYELMKEKGFEIGNIDSTIVAQKPKLAPYIPEMRKKIADVLRTDHDNVNVKATTEEELGLTGRQEGIRAYSVALLKKKQ